jgi:hypothetical protein
MKKYTPNSIRFDARIMAYWSARLRVQKPAEIVSEITDSKIVKLRLRKSAKPVRS